MTLAQKRRNSGYLFILPWLIGFVFLFAYPLLQSIQFSFNRIIITTGGYDLHFVGWSNYREALYVHAQFIRVLTGSVVQMVRDVPLILIFSLFAAVLVNQKFRGRMFARALFFLPVILTSGIIMKMLQQDWMIAFTQAGMGENTVDSMGLSSVNLRRYLRESGLNQDFIGYILAAVDNIYGVVNQSGVQILVLLAGLQSVSSSLYEAAYIEGATRWEAFWKITFPLVSPFLLACAVYTTIDSFTAQSNETMQLVHDTAFRQQQLALSAAMAWIYFAAVMAILGAVIALVSRKVFYRES